jgi:hypothetical protein
VQVKQYYHENDKAAPPITDAVIERANATAMLVAQGDMRKLRELVIQKWKDINRSYQVLQHTSLHIYCVRQAQEMHIITNFEV